MFTTKSPLLGSTTLRARATALAAAGTVACSAFALVPSGASAALIATGACNGAQLSQPFAAWGDASSYELLPGASFEGAPSGWTLSGGAHTVAGSEPYAATGAVGSGSLMLPAGSSAQSPQTCVNASYPTFRFFARNSSLLSTVLVQVVASTPLGSVSESLGAVALSTKWQPTLPMLTGSLVGGLLSGGTAKVAIRLTALTGSSQVDDIYMDPRLTH